MAQFRATIKGSRGMASRLGNKKTGITANVNAWDVGVDVPGRTDPAYGDFFDLCRSMSGTFIGRVRISHGKIRFVASENAQ